MPKLNIIRIGDQNDAILRQPTQRVKAFGPQLHKLLDDMILTMRSADGVGLAAPQVGISQRITVVEYPGDEDDPENTMQRYELINPKILKSKGVDSANEGCLSIPGLSAEVARATQITVRAQDRNGNEFRVKAYDWLARIFQHEIDHLDGTTMLDQADQVFKVRENEEGEVELIPIEGFVQKYATAKAAAA